jgi:hypothetical protein
MGRKKTDLAIVNRSFWPQNQVIGEALLQFAEKAAGSQSVCVITQAGAGLEDLLKREGRGQGVQVRACKVYTTSASGLVVRASEALIFMLWTFFSLVSAKPARVYVATDPPIVVPFIVALYCRLFRAQYFYHLQDIHPEVTNVALPLNRFVFKILRQVDTYTMRHAECLITITNDMRDYVLRRSSTDRPVFLLDNPSVENEETDSRSRTKDVVFCGNAGRLQLIPVVIAAIREYVDSGGRMSFSFAGGGVYSADLKALANDYEQIEYLGVIPAKRAADLVRQHRWALLPIMDEVTSYAFPSKSSGYALSGAGILAICGKHTSVARWVIGHDVGVVCEPELKMLVGCLFALENTSERKFSVGREFRRTLQISYFVDRLCDIVSSEKSSSKVN